MIRAARRDDVPAIFAVRTSVRENHLSLERLAQLGVTPASVATMLDGPAARTWVAEASPAPGGARDVVGFVMAIGDNGCLWALFVRPDAEGRGHGRALLGVAERWLFETVGCERIWLTTGRDPALRAHAFYRAAGWELVGEAGERELRYEKRRPRAPSVANTVTDTSR